MAFIPLNRGAAGAVAGDYIYKQNADGELELWKGDERIAVQSPDGNWFTDSITTGVGSFHLGGVHSIGSAGQNVTFKNNQTNVAWFPVWQGQSVDGLTLYNATVRNLDAAQVIAEPNGAALTTGSVDYSFNITAASNVSFTKLQFVIAEAYTGILHWTAAISGTSNLLADIDVGTKTTAYAIGDVVTIAFEYPLDLRKNDVVDLKVTKKNSDPKNQVVKCRAGATDNTKPYRKTWSRGFFDAEVAYEGNEADKKATSLKAKKSDATSNQTKITLTSDDNYYYIFRAGTGNGQAAKDSIRQFANDRLTTMEINTASADEYTRFYVGADAAAGRFCSVIIDTKDSMYLSKTQARLGTQTGASGDYVIRFIADSAGTIIRGQSNSDGSISINDSSYEVLLNNLQRYWADGNFTVIRGPAGTDAGATKIHLSNSEVFISGTGGTNGLRLTSTVSEFSTIPRPNSDNGYALGGVGYRWAQLFAGTATINTSDERKKHDISDYPASLLDAWGVHVKFKSFRWNADQNVGDDLHTGVIAQHVIAAFEAAGLDWREWSIIHDGGEHGYSVRYDHVMCIECAYQRRRLDRIEKALNL